MAKSKILNLIDSLFDIAQKEKWTKAYDKKLDYFCWTKPSMSKNIRLVKISREAILYLNLRGGIEGIGVEYLKNNFIQHNPEYKALPKLFTEKVDKDTFTIPKSKARFAMDKFEDFARDLASDIYRENLEHDRTATDIERLADAAIEN